MIKNLILIGLFVLPLFVLHGYDFRYPREMLALGLALGIAMFALLDNCLYCWKGRDQWILIFIGWCFVSTLFIPHIKGLNISGGASVDGLWNTSALLYLIVYALCFFVIANIDFDENLDRMAYAILIPAIITAAIVIGQYFGIENFFRNPIGDTESHQKLLAVTQFKLGGLMGHPTLSAAYMVMCLPMAFYLRRYFFEIVIVVAIVLTKSDVAIVALILSGLFLFGFGNGRRSISIFVLLLGLSVVLYASHFQIQDSGRFLVWSQIWTDMTTPFMNPQGLTYFFTGFGLGSFAFLFPAVHASQWLQAHNEYLQVFYGLGAIGICLLIYNLFVVYKGIWYSFSNREMRYFSTTFFVICVCAGGTFVWKLGVFQFYTVVILGIIYQLKRKLI